VQHLRFLVKSASDPVPAEFAHDAEPLPLGMGLDGVTDVAKVEKAPSMEGRRMTAMLAPKTGKS
jgi:hypothetical protein